MTKKRDAIKYIIGLVAVLFLRLLPHPPNVEPVTATLMPFAKRGGWFIGMAFGLLAILIYDLITRTLGIWSLMTAGTFALIGILANLYLKRRSGHIAHYVGFSIVAALIYDAITGIGTGMLFFGQTFMTTFLGQIPFTLYHLAGNIVLAALISPLLQRWVCENPELETSPVMNRIRNAFSA